MKAVLIGATGLVGREILKRLLDDPEFKEVQVFHRRSTGLQHPKLREEIIDFEQLGEWQEKIKGDVLFSALGTTLKVAGSKEEQYKVDYSYQFKIAAAAKNNGMETLVLISSTGANANSPFFYLRMKGELERAVENLHFKFLHILQPGPLTGDREVPRLSEKVSTALLALLPKIKPLAAYLPVKAEQVALKAVAASKAFDEGKHIYSPEQIYF